MVKIGQIMQNHKRWKDWKDMKIHERTNPNIWRYWRSYAESTDSTPINLLVLYPFKPVGCGGSLGWLCRGSSNSFKNGRTSSTDRPTALAASATNSCKCLRQTSHSQQWQSSFHKQRVGMWSQGHACKQEVQGDGCCESERCIFERLRQIYWQRSYKSCRMLGFNGLEAGMANAVLVLFLTHPN